MDETQTTKKVVAIGDLHCGNRVGLTPPKYQRILAGDKYGAIREETWSEYARMIDAQKPIDVLLVNGDAIDGCGWRQGGTDVIEPDRLGQCEIASEAILYAEAKTILLTKGTFYHTGHKEDFEDIISRSVKARKISAEETFKVNNTVFNCKHHIGRSSIPHGRATPILRERLNNILWEEMGLYPKADIIIRSHTHYFVYAGGDTYLCINLPSLSGLGSKYGSRIPSEPVNFGIVFFTVSEDNYSWGWDCVLGEAQKTNVIQL
jgi:predicted phosphodiesterase